MVADRRDIKTASGQKNLQFQSAKGTTRKLYDEVKSRFKDDLSKLTNSKIVTNPLLSPPPVSRSMLSPGPKKSKVVTKFGYRNDVGDI